MKKLFNLFSNALRATATFAPRMRKRGRLPTKLNRSGSKRLRPAIVGGNWQGIEYLTYAEHDHCKRAGFGAPHELAKKLRYSCEKKGLIEKRQSLIYGFAENR